MNQPLAATAQDAAAAERVRHSVKARAEIPDFTDRTVRSVEEAIP
mgnify:CR=1 FL=1